MSLSKESLDFFKELVETPSPSGFEQPAARIYRKYASKFTSHVSVDVMGNSIAVLNPKAERKIMLAGHIDQVGLIIKYINDQGFIYFEKIGGTDPIALISAKVQIYTKKGFVLGVIGRKAIHQLDEEEKKKVPKLEDLWIDIGAKNKEDALKRVSIGDSITLVSFFEPLMNNLYVARGFDNKMGAFIIAETIKELSKEKIDFGVYAVATVQEELGARGAKAAAYGVNPEVGIAVDVNHSNDIPSVNKQKEGEIDMGKGPTIARGGNINAVVFSGLVDIAKKNKISHQIDAAGSPTGTDANLMQVNKVGMATASVGVPLRYMHTQAEVLSLVDVESTIKLLVSYIKGLKEDMSFIPE